MVVRTPLRPQTINLAQLSEPVQHKTNPVEAQFHPAHQLPREHTWVAVAVAVAPHLSLRGGHLIM
jgi:hypothetical protein